MSRVSEGRCCEEHIAEQTNKEEISDEQRFKKPQSLHSAISPKIKKHKIAVS